jgi:hypothetical protein
MTPTGGVILTDTIQQSLMRDCCRFRHVATAFWVIFFVGEDLSQRSCTASLQQSTTQLAARTANRRLSMPLRHKTPHGGAEEADTSALSTILMYHPPVHDSTRTEPSFLFSSSRNTSFRPSPLYSFFREISNKAVNSMAINLTSTCCCHSQSNVCSQRVDDRSFLRFRTSSRLKKSVIDPSQGTVPIKLMVNAHRSGRLSVH